MSEKNVKYVELVEDVVNKVKPGTKTSEFYVTLATIGIGLLFSGGVINPGTVSAAANIAGPIITAGAGIVYTLSRAIAKLNLNK